jgi:hypothetical protein
LCALGARDPLITKHDENAMARRMAAIIGHIDPPLSNLEALLLFRPPRERLRRSEISEFATSIMEDILETYYTTLGPQPNRICIVVFRMNGAARNARLRQ